MQQQHCSHNYNDGGTFLGGSGCALPGAADELNAGEDVDTAGEEHGEALDSHPSLGALVARRLVPLVEVHALGLVVDVVEEAVLRDQEGVALERTGCVL